MCCEKKSIEDYIIGPLEEIIVNAFLVPSTNYVWEIKSSQGNIYFLPFTTDEDGYGVIDVSLLPPGFINPYLTFTIRVKLAIESCDYEKMCFMVKSDVIDVCIKDGNMPKAFVACPIAVPPTPGFTTGRFDFTGGEGQTTYQNDDLIGAKQVIVVNEHGVLQVGIDYNDYTFNGTTGTVTYNQTIEGQVNTIIYFK